MKVHKIEDGMRGHKLDTPYFVTRNERLLN